MKAKNHIQDNKLAAVVFVLTLAILVLPYGYQNTGIEEYFEAKYLWEFPQLFIFYIPLLSATSALFFIKKSWHLRKHVFRLSLFICVIASAGAYVNLLSSFLGGSYFGAGYYTILLIGPLTITMAIIEYYEKKLEK